MPSHLKTYLLKASDDEFEAWRVKASAMKLSLAEYLRFAANMGLTTEVLPIEATEQQIQNLSHPRYNLRAMQEFIDRHPDAKETALLKAAFAKLTKPSYQQMTKYQKKVAMQFRWTAPAKGGDNE